MGEKVSEGDFVEIDYIARIKETGKIFDLTREDVAKKENIYNAETTYKPISIIIGAGHVVKGLDKALVGMEVGKEETIVIPPEDGFGKRDPKNTRVVGIKQFLKRNINPVPGQKVEFDGKVGTVISANSGRVVIDFNHPYAGKNLVYDIKILRKITSFEEKAKSLLNIYLGFLPDSISIKEENDVAIIDIPSSSGITIPITVKQKVVDDIFKYTDKKEVKFVYDFVKNGGD